MDDRIRGPSGAFGEICIFEIFGKNVGTQAAWTGMGIHPFDDPTMSDDFELVRLPIDVREVHAYAAEWAPDRVTFFVDGQPARSVSQSPKYPMQFMLGIYEFDGGDRSSGPYPKRFMVDSFRAYRPRHSLRRRWRRTSPGLL